MSPKARVVASNSQGYRDDAFSKVINRIRREECFIIGNEFFNNFPLREVFLFKHPETERLSSH